MLWLFVFGTALTALVIADQVSAIRAGRGDTVAWLHTLLLLMVIACVIWFINILRRYLQLKISTFEMLVDQMGEGIGIVDSGELFVFANPAAERLFGVNRGELCGRSLREFLDEDSWLAIQEQTALRKQGESNRYELTIHTGDRQKRCIRVTASPEYDRWGKVTGTYGLMQDITAQREVADALVSSEKRYRNLVQRMSEGFSIVDPDERVTYANPALEEIFGVELGTLAGKSLYDFIGERDRRTIDYQAGLRREGKSSAYELPIRRPNGEMRLVYVSCNPVFAADGSFAYSYGLVQDITERKLAEAELQQLNTELEKRVAQRTIELSRSEERYRKLVELSPEAILMIADEKIAYANQAAAELLGAESAARLNGVPIKQFLQYGAWKALRPSASLIERLADAFQPLVEDITRLDGTRSTVEIRVTPIIYGEKSTLLAVARDITERQRAERALKESEEKYRALAENTPDVIMRFDMDCRHLFVNDVVRQIAGIEPREYLGRTHRELGFQPELCDYWEEKIKQVFRTGKPFNDQYEDKFNGRRAVYDLLLVPEYSANGHISTVLSTARDITKLKQVEEALRESEEFSRAALAHSPLGISMRNRTGKLLSYNESWQRIWAYTFDEIARDMSRDRPELKFENRDGYIGKWQSAVRRVYEKGGSLHVPDLEINGFRPGAAQWVSQYLYAIKDTAGQVDRVVIITEDITARKLAEAAARENERRFRDMLERLPDAVFVHCENEIRFANSAAVELLGAASATELVGRSTYDFVHPEYRKLVEERAVQVVEEKHLPLATETLLRIDGSLIPVEAGSTHILYEGKPASLAVVRDISARVEAERALRESEERFRMLVETMPDGLSVQDADKRFTYTNRTFCRILGYAEDELIGKPASGFLDAENQLVFEEQSALRERGELGQYELVWRHKTGHPVHTMVSPAPLAAADGSFIGSFAVLTDITELKRNEEILRNHWRLLDGIATAANILVQSDNAELALSECLAVLGHAASADRVHIFAKAIEPATGLPRFQHYDEWVRDGITPVMAVTGLQQFSSIDELPEIYESLALGRPVIRSAGTFSKVEQGLLCGNDIKSLLMVPISLAHEFWGFISLDDCRAGREWSDIEVTTLLAVAGSIGGFIAEARAESALRASEEAYRTLAGNLPGVVYRMMLQEGNRTQFFNDTVEVISGYTQEELHTGEICSIEPLIHEEDRSLVVNAIKRAIEQRASFEIEYRLKHKNGSLRWLAENGKPIIDEDGRPLYIDGVIFDITERKRSEEEREHLITELQDAVQHITTLRGLLPICSYCKKIRDDKGYWNQIEAYLMKHSEAEFSHGICPDCMREHFPQMSLHDKPKE